MSLLATLFVPGEWPTDNALLDLNRKCGARQQARRERKMGLCVDDYQVAVSDWQMRVRAAIGREVFMSGLVLPKTGLSPGRLMRLIPTATFLCVVLCKASRRDSDSASLAIKYARDVIFGGSFGDHSVHGHMVTLDVEGEEKRGMRVHLNSMP